ncbi:MAG: hypothetical protein AB8B69_14335 [Chitinophagales bacterium]
MMSLSNSFDLFPNYTPNASSWGTEVIRKSNFSLEDAQNYCLTHDKVTYFFHVKDGQTLTIPGRGTFQSNEAVFFTGTCIYEANQGQANSYQKIARLINCNLPNGYYFTNVKGAMQVPKEIPSIGTMFLWLGLQPSTPLGDIGNGVLQPVLTYTHTDSCAPNPTNLPTNQWWISGQYVNTDNNRDKTLFPNICNGGTRMALEEGKRIDSLIGYDATTDTWMQNCIGEGNTGRVTYNVQLTADGTPQRQPRLIIEPEPHDNAFLYCSVSMYEIVLNTNQPCSELLEYLQNENECPQVTNARVGSTPNEILIDRVVFSSPLYPQSPNSNYVQL